MAVWTIPDGWRAGHASADLLYRVSFRFVEADMDRVWNALKEEHPVDAEGDVLVGGAAIERVNRTDLDVVSGGEDALDSLDDAINTVLARAVSAADAQPADMVSANRLSLDATDHGLPAVAGPSCSTGQRSRLWTTLRILAAFYLIAFGAMVMYLGQSDDSPGFGGLGLITAAIGLILGIRTYCR